MYACKYYNSSVCDGLPDKATVAPLAFCQVTGTSSSRMTVYGNEFPTSNFDAPKVQLSSIYADELCTDLLYRTWMPSDTCLGPITSSAGGENIWTEMSWIGTVLYQSVFYGSSSCGANPSSIMEFPALDNVGVCTPAPTSSSNSSKVEFVSTIETPEAVGTQHAHTVHTFSSPDCTGDFTTKSYAAEECITKPGSSTTTTRECVIGSNETTTVVVTVDGEAPSNTTTTTGSVCVSSSSSSSTSRSSATASQFITNGNVYYSSLYFSASGQPCAGEPYYTISSTESGGMYGACTPSMPTETRLSHHGGTSHRVICDTCSSTTLPTSSPTRTPTLNPTALPSASPVTSRPTSAGETYAPSLTPTFAPTLHTAVVVAKVRHSDAYRLTRILFLTLARSSHTLM